MGGISDFPWGDEFNIRVRDWFVGNSPDSYLNWFQGPLEEIHTHIYGILFNWINPGNLDPNMSPVMRRIYNKPEFIVLLARLKLLSYLGHPKNQWDIHCDVLTGCIDLNAIIPYGIVAWDQEMDISTLPGNAEAQIVACGGTMPADSTQFFYDLRKEALILSLQIWPAYGTQQPGAMAASVNKEEVAKIHEDMIDAWRQCLTNTERPLVSPPFMDILYDGFFLGIG